LRSAANEVIDLAPLFRTFELVQIQKPAPARVTPGQNQQQQQRRRGPRPRRMFPQRNSEA
jgi:hypothetical protein